MSATANFSNFTGRIIWSADGLTAHELMDIIKSGVIPKGDVAIKLDRLFFEQYNRSIIAEIQENYGIPVFVDAKIIEIPSKAISIAKLYLKHHPWMLNAMAGACSTGLKQNCFLSDFAKHCQEAGTLSCAVTVLTSKTPVMVKEEFGGSNTAQQVDFYTHLLKENGLTDVVCSPQEIPIVKKYGLDINTPGVRLPGHAIDDQARVSTPHGAISSGATRIVVGRDIYRHDTDKIDDIPQNIERILANIRGEL